MHRKGLLLALLGIYSSLSMSFLKYDAKNWTQYSERGLAREQESRTIPPYNLNSMLM